MENVLLAGRRDAMTDESLLSKFVVATYEGESIKSVEVGSWKDALTRAEAPFLKIPRRWCHGKRDRGHWTLVQVIGSADVPSPVLNGSWSNGILAPGPLAIIWVPNNVQCCDHHLSEQARTQLKEARNQSNVNKRTTKSRYKPSKARAPKR